MIAVNIEEKSESSKELEVMDDPDARMERVQNFHDSAAKATTIGAYENDKNLTDLLMEIKGVEILAKLDITEILGFPAVTDDNVLINGLIEVVMSQGPGDKIRLSFLVIKGVIDFKATEEFALSETIKEAKITAQSGLASLNYETKKDVTAQFSTLPVDGVLIDAMCYTNEESLYRASMYRNTAAVAPIVREVVVAPKVKNCCDQCNILCPVCVPLTGCCISFNIDCPTCTCNLQVCIPEWTLACRNWYSGDWCRANCSPTGPFNCCSCCTPTGSVNFNCFADCCKVAPIAPKRQTTAVSEQTISKISFKAEQQHVIGTQVTNSRLDSIIEEGLKVNIDKEAKKEAFIVFYYLSPLDNKVHKCKMKVKDGNFVAAKRFVNLIGIYRGNSFNHADIYAPPVGAFATGSRSDILNFSNFNVGAMSAGLNVGSMSAGPLTSTTMVHGHN